MAQKPDHPKLDPTQVNATYSTTIGLRDAFATRCQKVGNYLKSFFVQALQAMFLEIPIAALRTLRSASKKDAVEAGKMAARWLLMGYELELATAGGPGTASAGEGGSEMPDPQARERLDSLEERFDGLERTLARLTSAVLGDDDQDSPAEADKKPQRGTRPRKRKK